MGPDTLVEDQREDAAAAKMQAWTHPLIYSLTHSLTHSINQLINQLPSQSVIQSFIQSVAHSLILLSRTFTTIYLLDHAASSTLINPHPQLHLTPDPHPDPHP